MKFFGVIVFLFYVIVCFAQQNTTIKVHTTQGTKNLPVYTREGTSYIPVKEFAEAMDLEYEMKDPGVISVNGLKSGLTISARNPFYSILDNSGKIIGTYQIPTSTYLISGRLYIPVVYSVEIINRVLAAELIYDDEKKTISALKKSDIPLYVESNSGFNISSISLEERANGLLIKFISNKNIPEYKSSFNEGVLTVSLTGVIADPLVTDSFRPAGLIKKLELVHSGTGTDFMFHLGDQYSASEIIRIDGGNDLLLTIHNKIFTTKNLDRSKEKWDFDVIVLDPGHGGKDAGAIGINRVREKDINLSIALLLGEMIEENMPGIRVEYTRKTDTFVELYKRGKIANEKDGKLFISIHCNSAPRKNSSASGFEVYLLRPGRTQEAIAIAEMENSVIEYEDDPKRYQKLTDENFILVSMAQSSYMKYSEKFSEYIDTHFSNGFGLSNRGVKQAGFYVLVGASMPSVLIEAGFLSNKGDATYLSSKKGQEKTAELLFHSIKSFKGYYESFLGLQ